MGEKWYIMWKFGEKFGNLEKKLEIFTLSGKKLGIWKKNWKFKNLEIWRKKIWKVGRFGILEKKNLKFGNNFEIRKLIWKFGKKMEIWKKIWKYVEI